MVSLKRLRRTSILLAPIRPTQASVSTGRWYGKAIAPDNVGDALHDDTYYQVAFILPQSQPITIGKLGHFHFEQGWYIYTGSARRGVLARLKRHLGAQKRQHWHVDYFAPRARAIAWRLLSRTGTTECDIVKTVLRLLPGSQRFPTRFGSSDCRCAGHLIWSSSPPPLDLC